MPSFGQFLANILMQLTQQKIAVPGLFASGEDRRILASVCNGGQTDRRADKEICYHYSITALCTASNYATCCNKTDDVIL